MTDCIVFENIETGKEYASITLKHATLEEVKATRVLISYEQGVPLEVVKCYTVKR